MIKYICKKCNITSSSSVCNVCGERTELESSTIYWCENCNIPIWYNICPICGTQGKKCTTDLRPVFPEERLLLEILQNEPLKYKDTSVWANPSGFYFINGKRLNFYAARELISRDPTEIRSLLNKYSSKNDNEYFQQMIKRFVEANKSRYEYITTEAIEYLHKISIGYDTTSMFVSFSGGKDSTATSSLVLRAFPNVPVLHIYGDTTLEFPETNTYVNRFKKNHPRVPVITAKNKTKDFYQLSETLGPPSRIFRFCCTVFKTGAIQRKITSLFKNKTNVLTFYGIRRSESASRKKYNRDSEGAKITRQMTASPIIDWLDYDIWLYLLTTGEDFNDAYKKGYVRVGCWCCPNNSSWSEGLSRIYMPNEYEKWHTFLVNFARDVLKKPDPENYIAGGFWKARQGGNGIEYSNNTVIKFEPCALQENTINFELRRPITEELYELFKPFGYINREMGNIRLGEIYILGKDGTPQLKLSGRIGTTILKVSILNDRAGHSQSRKVVEDKVRCQISKYQMCLGCLACQSVCKFNAIDIDTDINGLRSYTIHDSKCMRCCDCITHFDGGCYLVKVVRIQKKKGN